jgi:6-phosphofructokinase 2
MNILTVTVNPALDTSAKVDGLMAEQKMRCHSISHEAGGGGVNISRVLTTLKVPNTCLFSSGGDNGRRLEDMLSEEKIHLLPIPVKESTRENLAVVDTRNNAQYRFGMPGNPLSEMEQALIIQTIQEQLKEGDLLALSGSLTEGMADNFYETVVRAVKDLKAKVIIDTSGKALLHALDEPLFLIKPNQRELAHLAGKEFMTNKEQEAFALQLVEQGRVEHVAVSLGARGAFMASVSGIVYQASPSIPVRSTIGAGDSMVAGLIYGFSHGLALQDVLRYGVACGAATTMTEGTALATKASIERVLVLLA